jgi:biofilm PGA synthesis N-glycosyltransferase PgaC
MMLDFFWPIVSGKALTMIPLYFNFVLSVVWSYVMLFSLGIGILWTVGLAPPEVLPGFRLVPEWWGLTLTITYLAQALVSHLVERRYEKDMLRSLYWIIWFPLAFWLLSTITTVAALPRVLMKPRSARTTWVSPDRGLR